MTPAGNNSPLSSSLRQLLLLTSAAALLALGTWLLHPSMPSWSAGRMDAGAVHLAAVDAHPGPVLWVDARSEAAYNEAHIPGAVLLNEDAWEDGLLRFMSEWDPEQFVVIYCDAETCQASKAVMDRLQREVGIEKIAYLAGGWQEWEAAQ